MRLRDIVEKYRGSGGIKSDWRVINGDSGYIGDLANFKRYRESEGIEAEKKRICLIKNRISAS